MSFIADWLADIWESIQYWAVEVFKTVAKFGTTLWGLLVIIAGLLYTVLSHIVPMLSLVLDAMNSMVTGNFDSVGDRKYLLPFARSDGVRRNLWNITREPCTLSDG